MEFKHFKTNLGPENEYPKLVRDKIPAIVSARTGQETKNRILESDEEYLKFLLHKVQEEAYELANAEGREHVAEEAADVKELLDTILEMHGLTWAEVQEVQTKKAAERGGFRGRVLMIEKA
ncbi:phosphoribosyl-ATP pyrophosphohydrolase [Patescibacteria group bacterium]|nr:MAG: phosphoribosyl-ATP pyrophosphohydrolase [Patescibacteria group bacterium]